MAIRLIFFLLPQLILLQSVPSQAQQTCTPELESVANSLLKVALIYESAEEWDRAINIYNQVSASPCDALALEGQQGLQRVLENNNWLSKLGEQLQTDIQTVFSHVIRATLIMILIVIVSLFIFKIVLYHFSRKGTWSVWPFNDLTNQKLGGDIAELLVMNLHEIHFWHSKEETTIISLSESVDLPAFSGFAPAPSVLSTLSKLEKLGIGGIELPVGAMISSLREWLNLDGHRILGNIQRIGNSLEVNVRLVTGRQSKCERIWKHTARLNGEQEIRGVLNRIIEELAFIIVMDIVPSAWETNSAKALEKFTAGFKYLDEYDRNHSRTPNNLTHAREAFDAALQIDPTYRLATYNLALVELNLGHYGKAVNLLKSLQPTDDGQFDARINYNLGVAYYQQTHHWAYAFAEQSFEKVIAAFSYFPPSNRDKELLCLSHCGIVCLAAQYSREGQEDNWEKGQAHYQLAISLADDISELIAQAQYSLALLYLNSGEPEKAVQLLIETLVHNPYHWRGYTALGQTALRQKQYDVAIIELSKAVSLAPHYEYAHYLLGRAYALNEQPDLALDAFSRAKSISRAHDERGRIFALTYEDFEEAIVEFKEAIRLNSRLTDAHANLAWYLCEGNFLDNDGLRVAEEHAMRAVELTTRDDWHKLAVLGRVYYEGGKLSEARSVFLASQTLSANQPQVLYYLGLIDKAEGKVGTAKAHLTQLLQLPKTKTAMYWQDKAKPIIRDLSK